MDDEAQLNLLAGLGVKEPPSRDDVPKQTVSYERRAKVRDAAVAAERVALRSPLADAQSAHVLASGVLAMDETSLKAGRAAKGKMRTGWLWPVYGDAEEGVFHYAALRGRYRRVSGWRMSRSAIQAGAEADRPASPTRGTGCSCS